MFRSLVLFLALAVVGCASTQTEPAAEDTFDVELNTNMVAAAAEAHEQDAQAVKTNFLDPVIANCKRAFSKPDTHYYYARTGTESLTYLLLSAAEKKKSAEVLAVPCAQAHYLAAYYSIELQDISAAEQHIAAALHWSPSNALYLSESAHLMQMRGDWSESLRLFTQAEQSAEDYSPQSVRDDELTRAKRGMGFSLIELGRIEEAEKKFIECLEINPDDQKAKSELAYIIQQTGGKN